VGVRRDFQGSSSGGGDETAQRGPLLTHGGRCEKTRRGLVVPGRKEQTGRREPYDGYLANLTSGEGADSCGLVGVRIDIGMTWWS
jgi:hypothetical protein